MGNQLYGLFFLLKHQNQLVNEIRGKSTNTGEAYLRRFFSVRSRRSPSEQAQSKEQQTDWLKQKSSL